MFQRIFGTAKKERSSKTRDKDDAHHDRGRREEAVAHVDPAMSDSTPVATTTRTTSPTRGRRPRNSVSDNYLASSHSRSSGLAPESPSSPLGDAALAQNFSLTIRSDPVPVGFKNGSGSHAAGSPHSTTPVSPKFRASSSLRSPMSSSSFQSPMAHQAPKHSPQTATHQGNHTPPSTGSPMRAGGAAGAAGAAGAKGTRPMPVAHVVPQRPSHHSSLTDLPHSRTAPAFGSTSLLGSSTGRSGGLANTNSLAIGPGAADGVAGGGSTVNYWRLPWTQQKVVMCQFCNRPVRPRQPAAMNSKEYAMAGNSDSDMEEDPSEVDSRSSHSSESSTAAAHRSGLGSPLTTYCRCGQGTGVLAHSASVVTAEADADTAVLAASASAVHVQHNSDSLPTAPPPPPVFIVETDRSANIVIPGTLADDASSTDDSDDSNAGNHRPVKLSLVSPLTTSNLARNASYNGAAAPLALASRGTHDAQPSGNSRSRRADEPSSPPMPVHAQGAHSTSKRTNDKASSKGRDTGVSAKSVSSWLMEQEQEEHPLPVEEETEVMAVTGSSDEGKATTKRKSSSGASTGTAAEASRLGKRKTEKAAAA